MMNIAIFGAGYVGCVTAACLADLGHRIWLVEIDREKLKILRAGRSPVFEPGLGNLIAKYAQLGRISPIRSVEEAIFGSELGIVCVGTPSQADGSSNASQLRLVLKEIASAISRMRRPYVIAVRSTITFDQVRDCLLPDLAALLPERFGKDIAFALNPEFLREGHAIEDFRNPPFVVIGTEHALAKKRLKELYRGIKAPLFVVSIGSACLLKYSCNAFHALKVAFANEIGSLEEAFGADAGTVMEIFCRDHTLNLSHAYLRPGYAFGGACLPKDLRALNRVASRIGVPTPLLSSVLRSNENLMQRTFDAVESLKIRDVAFVGLSFKSGTDDLRESPLVRLAEGLLGKGYRLKIFDPDVQPEALRGRNLQYVQQHIGHLFLLFRKSAKEALRKAPLVIYGKLLLTPKQLVSLCAPGTRILDLTRQLPSSLASLQMKRLGGPDLRHLTNTIETDIPKTAQVAGET